MLPLSTNRRGIVGARTKEGCKYADADILLTENRMSVDHQQDVRKWRLVPFEAINAPECSGDRFLIPVPASLVDQTWVPEFGFQLSL